MTEEELDGFKEFAESINEITEEAFIIYQAQVEEIYRNKVNDEKEIERVIDVLLGYCYDDKMLLLFKKLCRYYFEINPSATCEYVYIYREMWDEESDEESQL